VAVIALATLGFLLAGVVLIDVLGLPALGVQLASWTAWLIWLGVFFPRSSLRDRGLPRELPYRRAFVRAILPGIAWNFAQLLRPSVEGILGGGWQPDAPRMAAGAALVALGMVTIVAAARTLGTARTLFVHEYLPVERPVTSRGLYGVVRHPLFVGGVAVSVGLGLAVGTPLAIALAAMSVAALPIYAHLEDRRCCRVLEDPYVRYRGSVGAFFPRAVPRLQAPRLPFAVFRRWAKRSAPPV
jgi:protein-S-isoprenylcysteine O-methyltransferase Ste14